MDRPGKEEDLMNPQRISPVIHTLIYELRYDYGYTYLDRCGAVVSLN